MKPARIQLSRAKGWRMPSNTVKVDRSTRWGNWHRVGHVYDCRPVPKNNAEAVAEFRADLKIMIDDDPEDTERWLAPLRGKNLACWCKPGEPCHADVLLEIANATSMRPNTD